MRGCFVKRLMLFLVMFSISLSLFASENKYLLLYDKLHKECAYNDAALLSRKLAVEQENPNDIAFYLLYAANSYSFAKDFKRMLFVLDDVENLILENDLDESLENTCSFMSGYCYEKMGDYKKSIYYYNSFLNSTDNIDELSQDEERALSGLVSMYLKTRDYDNALKFSKQIGKEKVVAEYIHSHDKSPRVGGFLGIVPGLGYAYSGEYGNALRCLLLNSLFIWGMVETAESEEWGAFSIITFFELTWYTGSIYGGIDSAHRYNKTRLDNALREVNKLSGSEESRPNKDVYVPLFFYRNKF